MKTISVCVLLFFLSIVAYSHISAAPGNAAQPGNDDQLVGNLPTYLFLHKTWNENTSAPTAAGSNVCPE